MKKLIYISLIMMLSLLYGCPQNMVKIIDDYKAGIDSARANSSYLSSTKTYKSFEEVERVFAFDSLRTLLETSDTVQSPFNLRIREITDKHYPDSIILKVLLFDNDGKALTGMAPPNFIGKGSPFDYWYSLQDSCENSDVKIENFKVEEITSFQSEPFSIAFLLDHSQSMGLKRMRLLQSSLKRILYAVKPGDEVAIINFTETPKVQIPLSDDRNDFILKYNFERAPGGGTDTYNAINLGFEQLDSAKSGHKRIVVLFSDGVVAFTKSQLETIRKKSQDENISVYSISYGMHSATLQELSEYTGGRYYPIFTTKQIPLVFRDIYLSLNSYYKITYKAPECDNLHKVKLGFKLPELNDHNISTYTFYDKSIFTNKDTLGTVAFLNIEFEFGKSEIKSESIPLIEEIAESMKNYPDLKIQINGHTDNIGSPESNMKLSKERAESVKRKLIEMGIEPHRLTMKAYGETKPIAPNDTDENRKKNRRTEFVIIER